MNVKDFNIKLSQVLNNYKGKTEKETYDYYCFMCAACSLISFILFANYITDGVINVFATFIITAFVFGYFSTFVSKMNISIFTYEYIRNFSHGIPVFFMMYDVGSNLFESSLVLAAAAFYTAGIYYFSNFIEISKKFINEYCGMNDTVKEI